MNASASNLNGNIDPGRIEALVRMAIANALGQTGHIILAKARSSHLKRGSTKTAFSLPLKPS